MRDEWPALVDEIVALIDAADGALQLAGAERAFDWFLRVTPQLEPQLERLAVLAEADAILSDQTAP